MWRHVTFGGNWSWCSATFTEMFAKHAQAPEVAPTISVKVKAAAYSGWAAFIAPRFQFVSYVTTVNAGTGARTVDSFQFLDATGPAFGSFKGRYPIHGALFARGTAAAAPRVHLAISATILGRVAAPFGHARFPVDGRVEQISTT